MPRTIKEGDIVLVFVTNDETELWAAVHCGRDRKYRKRRFEVMSTPADTGDMWYLRDTQDETELAINPASTNLDGFVKVGNVNEPIPNYQGCRIIHAVSYDKDADMAVLRCQGLDGEWAVKLSTLDAYTQQWLEEHFNKDDQ